MDEGYTGNPYITLETLEKFEIILKYILIKYWKKDTYKMSRFSKYIYSFSFSPSKFSIINIFFYIWNW